MPDCSAPAGPLADLCNECSVDELRAQHRLMRETLGSLAAHMAVMPQGAAAQLFPADVRQQLDELIKAGVVKRPAAFLPSDDDESSSGIYEAFEDPESTCVILADLHHLARKLGAT